LPIICVSLSESMRTLGLDELLPHHFDLGML